MLYRLHNNLTKGGKIIKKGQLLPLDDVTKEVIDKLIKVGAISPVLAPPICVIIDTDEDMLADKLLLGTTEDIANDLDIEPSLVDEWKETVRAELTRRTGNGTSSGS